MVTLLHGSDISIGLPGQHPDPDPGPNNQSSFFKSHCGPSTSSSSSSSTSLGNSLPYDYPPIVSSTNQQTTNQQLDQYTVPFRIPAHSHSTPQHPPWTFPYDPTLKYTPPSIPSHSSLSTITYTRPPPLVSTTQNQTLAPSPTNTESYILTPPTSASSNAPSLSGLQTDFDLGRVDNEGNTGGVVESIEGISDGFILWNGGVECLSTSSTSSASLNEGTSERKQSWDQQEVDIKQEVVDMVGEEAVVGEDAVVREETPSNPPDTVMIDILDTTEVINGGETIRNTLQIEDESPMDQQITETNPVDIPTNDERLNHIPKVNPIPQISITSQKPAPPTFYQHPFAYSYGPYPNLNYNPFGMQSNVVGWSGIPLHQTTGFMNVNTSPMINPVSQSTTQIEVELGGGVIQAQSGGGDGSRSSEGGGGDENRDGIVKHTGALHTTSTSSGTPSPSQDLISARIISYDSPVAPARYVPTPTLQTVVPMQLQPGIQPYMTSSSRQLQPPQGYIYPISNQFDQSIHPGYPVPAVHISTYPIQNQQFHDPSSSYYYAPQHARPLPGGHMYAVNMSPIQPVFSQQTFFVPTSYSHMKQQPAQEGPHPGATVAHGYPPQMFYQSTPAHRPGHPTPRPQTHRSGSNVFVFDHPDEDHLMAASPQSQTSFTTPNTTIEAEAPQRADDDRDPPPTPRQHSIVKKRSMDSLYSDKAKSNHRSRSKPSKSKAVKMKEKVHSKAKSSENGLIKYTTLSDDKLTDLLKRQCYTCGGRDPPSWRRSTLDSANILCNRCGIFERSHGFPRTLEMIGKPIPKFIKPIPKPKNAVNNNSFKRPAKRRLSFSPSISPFSPHTERDPAWSEDEGANAHKRGESTDSTNSGWCSPPAVNSAASFSPTSPSSSSVLPRVHTSGQGGSGVSTQRYSNARASDRDSNSRLN